MRTIKTLAAAILLAFIGTGCSVWQNASRKYLESSAYDFAGLKLQEKLIGCAVPIDDPSWSESPRDDGERALTRFHQEHFELRVTNVTSATACDYAFDSAEEREVATDAAIQHARTLHPAP